ncbi:DMT family transporter [Salisaeta longa]|uniref:DMT family transporter n=1 Tax=Salisaeta longa TaxID=503170 RepID=UPI0003B7717F|nr:DMT family transporter [Salisaeta longa]
MKRTDWLSDASLLATVCIWGANFPILKAALAVMHPHAINVFRFLIAAVVLGALYVWKRPADESFTAPLRSHGYRIAGLGLLGYVVYQVFFIIGVHNTTAGSAALILASAPLWTALVGRVFGYETLRPGQWIGLVCSLVGTALVIIAGANDVGLGAGSLYGNLMMLAGAMLWGSYTGLNKSVVDDVSPVATAFWGIVVALPFLVAVGVPYLPAVEWAAVGPWTWAAVVYSGALSIGLAFAIWTTAVRNVGASNTAVYNNLVPFVALIGGAVFLEEPIHALQIGGGVLIIVGLVLMRRLRPNKTAA